MNKVSLALGVMLTFVLVFQMPSGTEAFNHKKNEVNERGEFLKKQIPDKSARNKQIS